VAYCRGGLLAAAVDTVFKQQGVTMNKQVLGFCLAMLAAVLAHAEPPISRPAGIEVRDYPWQAPAGEKSKR
jgi:hypothetical protein